MKERAGFGVRAAALVIDGILLMAVSVFIGLMASGGTALLVHKLGLDSLSTDPGTAYLASGLMAVGIFILVTSLVATFLSLPYNLMEAAFGWTPGKLAMGLRVRNEDGASPTFGQVFLRWLIKHIAILLGLLTFIGIPVAIFSPILQAVVFCGCFLVLGASRQALHDMASHTAIYEVSQLNAEPDQSVL